MLVIACLVFIYIHTYIYTYTFMYVYVLFFKDQTRLKMTNPPNISVDRFVSVSPPFQLVRMGGSCTGI